jgi:Sec-independent protein translocase protein TatA
LHNDVKHPPGWIGQALLGIYRKAFQNMNAALQHQQTMGAQQQQQQHQQQQQQKVDGKAST